MIKKTAMVLISIGLLLSGCASNQSTNSSSPVTPYAGTYTGTETFDSGVFPLRIYIKNNGKISIVDVDNIRANGRLEGNKFTVKRYGNSPMVFAGTITDSTISGVGTGNRFLGDGTFTVTLEE